VPILSDPALAALQQVKRRRLALLIAILLVGAVTAIGYHYVMAFYNGLGYPQATFLFRPEDHFNDWNNPYVAAKAFLNGQDIWIVYFPLGILTTLISTVAPMRAGFVAVTALFLATLLAIFARWVTDAEPSGATKVQYWVVLTVLSYPVLFLVDRGNLEMLVFLFLAGFFYFFYVRESTWLAALFLAAAIACKLYPATLLLLYLAERRYKGLALTAVFTAALTALATVAVAGLGGISVAHFLDMSAKGRAYYQDLMVIGNGGLQHAW
jgi:hypothetical protein